MEGRSGASRPTTRPVKFRVFWLGFFGCLQKHCPINIRIALFALPPWKLLSSTLKCGCSSPSRDRAIALPLWTKLPDGFLKSSNWGWWLCAAVCTTTAFFAWPFGPSKKPAFALPRAKAEAPKPGRQGALRAWLALSPAPPAKTALRPVLARIPNSHVYQGAQTSPVACQHRAPRRGPVLHRPPRLPLSLTSGSTTPTPLDT